MLLYKTLTAKARWTPETSTISFLLKTPKLRNFQRLSNVNSHIFVIPPKSFYLPCKNAMRPEVITVVLAVFWAVTQSAFPFTYQRLKGKPSPSSGLKWRQTLLSSFKIIWLLNREAQSRLKKSRS